jgi:hypothetical protein
LDDREGSVRRNMERLVEAEAEGGYASFVRELTTKRDEWYEANKDALRLEGSEVRRAYALLLIRYLGLDPAQVPVVYEDEVRIIWRSFNFCPLLEACRRLGKDTREVCRRAQEAPAQALVSKVSPRLKFSRNYDRIRPYEQFCEEMIEKR